MSPNAGDKDNILTIKNVIAMYKVNVNGAEVFQSPTMEPAVAFALELHRICNVKHTIVVDSAEGLQVIIFELKNSQSK